MAAAASRPLATQRAAAPTQQDRIMKNIEDLIQWFGQFLEEEGVSEDRAQMVQG